MAAVRVGSVTLFDTVVAEAVRTGDLAELRALGFVQLADVLMKAGY